MTQEEIIKMQISRIEKEIRDLPYHKGTEHHHGVMKARIAKLNDQLNGGSNKGGGGGVGYAIKHSGDASVVLVGLPSVGKSTLLNAVTNAESRVGNYDFTTLGVVPGMMEYKGVKIQMLDLPGIIEGATKNKGFGKKVLSVIRASDLVVLMTDVKRIEWIKQVEDELYHSGIRLNTRPAKISIHRTHKGAIQVIDPYQSFEKETVIDIAKEMGLGNAIIQIGEKVVGIDKLIDSMSKSIKYMAAVEVVTKIDLAKNFDPRIVGKKDNIVLMCADKGIGLEDFKEKVWKGLGLVRVFLKRERNMEADFNQPLILKNNSTLDDVLKRISNQMRDDVNKAYIWGKKAKFPGQEVSFTFQVFDEMEVFFGR
ncbi:MAG: GTPase [Candidatus Shapirobacteria bacterium]